MTNAYDFSFTAIDGSPLPLSQFEGQVLLVVNTASQCGFTPQYNALQEVYEQYKDQGFTVIGVPCNAFGKQEPGSSEEIQAFTEKEYQITFPLTQKADVSGDNAHPFFKWAGEQAGFIGRPKWNFHKYLIGRDGQFITWFSSMTSPESSKLKESINVAIADNSDSLDIKVSQNE